MSEQRISDPKIVDVIAKKSTYSDQIHYYVIVDQPVTFVYTRSLVVEDALFARLGHSFFLGRCGDFYNFLSGTARKGDAFAGREFDITLDDGTSFHCQGDVWACCSRKSDPPVVQIGVATLEQLKDCYVFCSGHVTQAALDAWLSENEPTPDYYKYDTRPKYVPPPNPKRQRTRGAAYRARRVARRALKEQSL